MSQRWTGISYPDACDEKVASNSHSVDIQWGLPREPDFPEDAQMVEWASEVLAWLGTGPVEICVRMMDAEEIADLNFRYRRKQGPTNVLSFPGAGEDETGRTLLGDLALCTSVIREEAASQRKPLAAHTAHMLVHGILHLSGYDHENDRDAREMEQLEIAILGQFGIADPYAELIGKEEEKHE